MSTPATAQPSAAREGWDDAFDRQETEQRGPEKPTYILNARQLEFNAHIKKMMAAQKGQSELV
jgi:hypothetical protein